VNEVLFVLSSGRLLRGTPASKDTNRWEVIGSPGDVSSRSAGRDGTVLALTNGLLFRLEGAQFESLPTEKGFVGKDVRALLTDASGRLWAGTDTEIAVWMPEAEARSQSAVGHRPSTSDQSLVTSAATGFKNMTPTNGEPELAVTGMVATGDGIWVTANGRTRRCRDGQWVAEAPNWKPEPSLSTAGYYGDREGGIWGHFGTGLLHVRPDGEVRRITTEHGLANDRVACWFQDREGNIWAGLNRGGLVRVRPRHFQVLGVAEGLTDQVAMSVCEDAEGATVVIEEVLVDGKSEITSRQSPILEIGPGRHHVEFHFTGLSFSAPDKVQFQYKLEGLDRDWLNAGGARAASYSYVPAGDYRFRVRACNNDGVWNETGASLAFVVPPYFWQTWWFLALAALTAFGTVGGAIRFVEKRKLQRRLERLERERAIERERARIAQDIHDDLGASLTRITLLSESAQDARHGGDAATPEIDQIYSTARELTRAMDEIVWAVNPQHDTLDSLATYLGKFAQDFLRVARVRCRLDMPVQLTALPLTSETRHNLFLAFKEALHNAVKHAAASEVRVQLRAGFHAVHAVGRGQWKGLRGQRDFPRRRRSRAPGNRPRLEEHAAAAGRNRRKLRGGNSSRNRLVRPVHCADAAPQSMTPHCGASSLAP
jgi:two-component sensor histidine kinase